MKFELLIDSDSPIMRSRLDVSWALDSVSKRLRGNTEITKAPVRDTSGNQVGYWTIDDDDATPVADDHGLDTTMTLAEIKCIGRDIGDAQLPKLTALKMAVERALLDLGPSSETAQLLKLALDRS